MKSLVCISALTLAIAASAAEAIAAQSPFRIATAPLVRLVATSQNFKSPHIVHSVAYPNIARAQNATYHIGLSVNGNPLSQLMITLPENTKSIKGIEVTDRAGKKVDATVSINGEQATIAFNRPVSEGTMLEVELKSVITTRINSTHMLAVSGRSVGLNAEIPFGTAIIQTYGR